MFENGFDKKSKYLPFLFFARRKFVVAKKKSRIAFPEDNYLTFKLALTTLQKIKILRSYSNTCVIVRWLLMKFSFLLIECSKRFLTILFERRQEKANLRFQLTCRKTIFPTTNKILQTLWKPIGSVIHPRK